MMPGPTLVVECPTCSGTAMRQSWLSGNMLGERFYTDGKYLAPMLPKIGTLEKCVHCRGVYWVADAKIVSTISPGTSLYDKMSKVLKPTEEEHYQLIDSGFAKDRDQERILRILYWWKSNDKYRDSKELQTSQPESYLSNLEVLADLLDEKNESQLIMKAEVMRQLGKFDRAMRLLDSVKTRDLKSGIASQIRKLCREAICKEIVVFHGGTMRIESEVGKGSTFSFSMPASSFSTMT